MSFTVTATQGGGTNAGMCLAVIVLTNAAEAGGASLGTQQTGAAHGTLTPNFSGSLIYWAISDFTLNTAWTLDASNSTSATGLGVLIGASAPAGNATSIAGYEIKGISGSPLVDASPPAFTGIHATAATSSAFTPPAGAV